MHDMLANEQNPKVQQLGWMAEKELILVNNLEDGEDTLKRAVDECIDSGVYAIDLETTGLDNRVFNGKTECTIVGVCLSPDGVKGYYVPVLHKKHGSPSELSECNIQIHVFRREMKRLVDSDAIAVFHNGKFDQEFLQFNGGETLGTWDQDKKWDDTLILAYLTNPRARRVGLKFLSKELLGMEMIEIKAVFQEVFGKKYKGPYDFSLLDPLVSDCVTWYGASDAICTFLLRDHFLPGILQPANKGGQLTIYRIEKSCVPATRWMERNRIHIDRAKVAHLIQLGQKESFESMKEVYEMASEMLGRNITPMHFVMVEKEIRENNPEFSISAEGKDEKLAFNKLLKECQNKAKVPLFINEDPMLAELSTRVPVTKKNRRKETVTYPAEYDVMSPKQLGLMLDELGIPGLKRTEKSKQIQTSKDEIDRVLNSAGDRYPWTAKIVRFRETQKALGTYLLPLWEDAHPVENTIRVNYNGHRVDTGRFATPGSKNPSEDGGTRYFMQGTPATYDPERPECLLRVRECMTARKGRFIVAIDYAGVELRIVTNLSREPLWLKEFFHCAGCDLMFEETQEPPRSCPKCGSDKIGDLHTLTALSIFGEEARQRDDWKRLRGGAKAVNFALCYGGGGGAVCRATGVEKNEGWRIKNQFDKTYKGLKMWWVKSQRFGKKRGYVQTALGRRYPVPDIQLPEIDPDSGRNNKMFISKAMRNAVNGPVQAGSADLTKAAMVFVYKACKKRGWLDKCRMIITMHDELVFEIDGDILEEAIEMICEQMTSNGVVKSLNWPVPLLVDVEMGKDWTVPWDLGALQRGEVRFIGDKKYKKAEDLPAGYDWDSLPKWPEALRPYFKAASDDPAEPPKAVVPVKTDEGEEPPEPVPSVGQKIKQGDQNMYEYVVQPPYTLGKMEALAQAIATASGSGASKLVLKTTEGGEIPLSCGTVFVNEVAFNWAAKQQGLV